MCKNEKHLSAAEQNAREWEESFNRAARMLDEAQEVLKRRMKDCEERAKRERDQGVNPATKK